MVLLELHGDAAWCFGETCFWGWGFLLYLFSGDNLFSWGPLLWGVFYTAGGVSPGVLWGEGGGTTSDRPPARKRRFSPELGVSRS